jgi:hypothetical protein
MTLRIQPSNPPVSAGTPGPKVDSLAVTQLPNETFGIAVIVSWIITVSLAVTWLRRREGVDRWISVILALHWIWVGSFYHLMFFRRINPAAILFGTLFIVQGLLLIWHELYRGPLRYQPSSRLRKTASIAFIGYGLLYPFLTMMSGFEYPAMPAFAVPCPITLVTVGWLIAIHPRAPRLLLVVPVLWCVVASTAAIEFRVLPDLALIAGAVALIACATGARRGSLSGVRSCTL